VVHDDLVFCCNGCLRVYELLTEPQCPVPGTAPTERSYAFLDVAEHGEKFIRRDAEGHARAVFFLPDMSCASCVQFLEQLHRKHEAILRSEVNFPRKEVRVLFDDKGISLGAVATLLSQSGYPPEVRSEAQTGRKKDYRLVTRIGVAGFCFGNIMLMSFPEYLGAGHLEESFRNAFGWLNMILSIPIVAYSGRGYLSSAYAAFRNRTVNIDVPITIGIIALFGRSSWEIITGYGAGYFDSLAGLIFFLLIGKWYQQRTYGALSYERDYKSYFPIAVLKREPGANRFVAISELRPGDEVIIHHREIVPADCTLISGDARIDYSFVTGESDPIRIAEGEAIQAGGRQTGGAIVALVRKPVEQSRLTRLWNSDAFKKEANDSIQDPVDRISKYFTWVVVSIALGAFIFWYPRNPSVAWNALAATLIVACPCALALTLPFTFGSIMRLMGKSGLYLKNAGVIEVMARIRHLVFDKTGTLTRANDYQLTWHGVAMSDAEQRAVSAVAAQSAHPLSRAIHQRLSASDALVEQFEETTGKGVSARVNGSTIRLGSRTWVDAPINDTRGSQVHLNIDGSYVGYFSFEKPLRGGLSNELARLGKHFDLHLISGDNSGDRERFSSFFSGLRMHFNQQPEDKMDYIKGLSELAPVAMVGDGLNDAGALKAADFGVAVVDDLYAFSPACDAILHADRLQHFDRFMGLSRSAMRIVKRSFGISFLYNAIGISFAVQGLLTPLVAAILMPLSSVTIVVFTVVSAHYYASKHGLSAR
jgi:Cu+-exporting ATPase